MAKVRGRGRRADSVSALNSGTYDIAIAEDEMETLHDKACSALTRLAEAKATKNKVFRVRSLTEH